MQKLVGRTCYWDIPQSGERLPMGSILYMATKERGWYSVESSRKEHLCLCFVLKHRWLASTTLHSSHGLLHMYMYKESSYTWTAFCQQQIVGRTFSMPGNDEALVSTTLRLTRQSTIRKIGAKPQLYCTRVSQHFRVLELTLTVECMSQYHFTRYCDTVILHGGYSLIQVKLDPMQGTELVMVS